MIQYEIEEERKMIKKLDFETKAAGSSELLGSSRMGKYAVMWGRDS